MRKKRLKSTELRELQNKKLRALIKHSYEHVPYYNSIFRQAKLTPDDIKTVDDLHKIPVTTKKDIIDLPSEKIIAENTDPRKCWIFRTSGTSGKSLSVYWEKKAKTIDIGYKYLWQLECGDRITAKRVAIGSTHPLHHSFEKIGIFKAKRISPFEDLKTQIEQIREYRTETMHALPSCVMALGREAIGEDIKGIDVNLIFTGGELADEHTRKLAENAFGAEMFDAYGATEVGRISNECVEHNGHHTIGGRIIVEFTRDGETVSPGREGDVTVTSLDNYAMPIIRYNMEDIGISIEEECSCRNCSPRMSLTEGRKKDVIHLPNGKIAPAIVVIGGLNNIEGIKQFQIVQEKVDRINIRVIRGIKFADPTIDEIKRIVEEMLGNVEIEVSVVDAIKREKSGKFRPFITRIPTK